MKDPLPKQTSTSAPLVLTIVLVFFTAGCFLDDKIIQDTYSAVFGVLEDTTQEIAHFTNPLPGSYCIGANRKLELSGSIKQFLPGPAQLDVEAALRDNLGVEKASQIFPMVGKTSKTGSTFRSQKFDFNLSPPNNCIPPGWSIYVAVTPRGGDIEPNAELKSKMRLR